MLLTLPTAFLASATAMTDRLWQRRWQVLTWMLQMGVLVWLLAPMLGHAQDMPTNISQIANSSPQDDESRKLWRLLLGNFADNPFTAIGTPNSLLGGMFLVINTCFFIVGVTYFSYGIVKGVVATAQEGEVLGKRQSVTWFPIRGVIGVAGSMPVFGGFNMMQAVLMFIMLVGIGTANLAMNKALDMTNQFQGMLQPAAFDPSGQNKSARDVARQMFLAKVCMYAHNDVAQQVLAQGVSSPLVSQYSSDAANGKALSSTKDTGRTHTIMWGTPSAPDACGSVSISTWQRSESSWSSFRVGSVDYANYARISAAMEQGWTSAITQMDTDLSSIAQNWYDQRKAALAQDDGNVPAIDIGAIDSVAARATQTAGSVASGAIGSSGSVAITSAAMQNMKSLGWIGVGAWYSTFAEANAALADATNSVELSTSGVAMFFRSKLNDGAAAAIDSASEKIMEGEKARGSQGNATKTLLDSAIQDTGCGALGVAGNSVAGTATGNCSLGQGIVSAFIRGTTVGSGGGGNGSATGMDQQGLVNPIISMKNMGDYVLTFASTMILAGPVSAMVEMLPVGKGAKMAAAVADKAAAIAGGEKLSGALAFLKVLAFVLLVAGAAMSVYIPMIPFITWMGAVLSYAASMFEGLAGMSLHAVSHLESEGEGLGQRTSQGYLFWINALARPALMVIGFFAASALLIAIGTLQAKLFLPAMASVQGNSVTGLASIILFLLVFFVMNVTLISGSMNLIFVITDQVIGFLGGAFNSHLGREVEGKINAAFMMAARVGPSAIGQAQGAMAAAKKTPSGGGALGGTGSSSAKPTSSMKA